MAIQTQPGDIERQLVANRSTWVSAAVNITLSIAQVIAGLLAHSQGLIADGLHSLSDLLSDAVVLVANRHSHKGPDDDHHYGHARFENAASLLIGLLLLVVGLGMLWAGVNSIQNMEARPVVQQTALWAACASLLVKEGLFRYLIHQARAVGSSLLIANAWHARSDAASSLVVAIGIGGSLMGYPILDPVAGLVVGLMICKMGVSFSWTALSQLADQALPAEDVAAIRQTLQAVPGVANVHDLRTRHMGDLAIVDAHLDVNPWISVSEGHWVAAHARQALIAMPTVMDAQIHIDPATADASIGVSLPLRADIEQWFTRNANNVHINTINLHYLDGKLLLDVITDTSTDEDTRLYIEQLMSKHWPDHGVQIHRWMVLQTA